MHSEPPFAIPDLEYYEEEQTNKCGEVAFEEIIGGWSGTARSLILKEYQHSISPEYFDWTIAAASP